MLSHRTSRGHAKLGLLLGGFVATAALGCGGQAESDAFSDDESATTGGSGGSGGSGGTGAGGSSSGGSGGVSSTAASMTSGPSTATTAGGSGGSGGAPDPCLQPMQAGSCQAYFPSWGFNTETGRCEEFVYGGCEGNDNRFENLEACLAACDPGGRDACENSTDCVLDHGCCGFCGTEPADLVAVNQNYATFQSLECQLVDCEICSTPFELDPFGARCNAGTCEVYDIRKSLLSECTTDADCRMRAGLSCCQGCGSDVQWVAVSTDDRVEQELCGEDPVGCPDCEPNGPQDLGAFCGDDGHCTLGSLL